MKIFLKYGVVPIVILGCLLIVTVMLIPVLLNVQKFVPAIEEKISEAAGRSVSIGPDLGISFFPWLNISFSDMKIGNPPGFLTDEMVKIGSFEARIKLLPLLKKEIRISRFVVGGLVVNLEKNSEGEVNWEFNRPVPGSEPAVKPPTRTWIDTMRGSVFCSLLVVTDGEVSWIDRSRQIRHTASDLMILLNDVAVDRPIALDFKTSYDGKPIALEGKIGPLWQNKDNEPLSIGIDFSLADTIQGRVQGKIENWRSTPDYDVSFSLASFSPRKLFEKLNIPFPVVGADTDTFQTVELSAVARGTSDALAIDQGSAQLDDTRLIFSLQAKNFIKPEIEFFGEIDRLDLDRYLTPETDGKTAMIEAGQKRTNPWNLFAIRDVSLAGAFKLKSLKVHGGTVTDMGVQLGGKDGIFTMDGASMVLYGGQLQANVSANLVGEIPKTRVTLQSQDVQVEAMLREFGDQDIITGTLASDIALEFSGDTVDAMRKTLTGEATFSCRDGALLGVDLQRAMQGRKGGDAGSERDQQTPQTDFSELKSIVTLNNGLLDIRETTLTSPTMELEISGTADLGGKGLNLQVVPKGMKLKQGKDAKVRSPLPLKVTGTFARPVVGTDSGKYAESGAAAAKKTNVANLVDEKIPSPVDDDVKALVGKPLIDPAIVTQRFHLQPETIKRSEVKIRLRVGSGRIRINPLREEDSMR